MWTRWAFVKLRHLSLSPAANAFLAHLRAAHAAGLAEEAMLEKRWRGRLPNAASADASSPGRRRKPKG
jgi:hypothetical protein